MIKRQFTRWVIVGVVTNASLYLAYLGLTRSLLAPKAAMTVVYAAGVLLGFLGNRSWSFEHVGRVDTALLRYVAVYVLGYAINFAGLEIGVDMLALPHEVVQGAMIIVVAAVMFVMQKLFVFAGPRDAAGTSPKVHS
jgi:putative flippase GtrA